ncbi:MAG: hypothetical protein KAI41_06580, partial [Hyphomicrobiaceae bacterium]|nr:hypothetical protein [Hyphomicrobiaceae bacterium]
MGDCWTTTLSEASGDDVGNRMLRESGEGRWGCTGVTQTFAVRRHVRFAPESRHTAGTQKCPLSAKSGHMGPSNSKQHA